MPRQGSCLALRFGVTNQSGVLSSEIPVGGALSGGFSLATFKSEISNLFGGAVCRVSRMRFRLTEAEKVSLLINPKARFSRRSVSGTFSTSAESARKRGFNLIGLGPWVQFSHVETFIKKWCKTEAGNAVTYVFASNFKRRA